MSVFGSRLEACESLVDIFELVKEAVRRFLDQHRAGLMLGMANFGMRRGSFVGAFHPLGSNIIVMNRAPFDVALRVNDKRVFNGYCFHLLLHEYLHALGYVDEGRVRDLVHRVCSLSLGKDSPATVMAEKGLGYYFPRVTYFSNDVRIPRDIRIELVKDFDRSNTGYID